MVRKTHGLGGDGSQVTEAMKWVWIMLMATRLSLIGLASMGALVAFAVLQMGCERSQLADANMTSSFEADKQVVRQGLSDVERIQEESSIISLNSFKFKRGKLRAEYVLDLKTTAVVRISVFGENGAESSSGRRKPGRYVYRIMQDGAGEDYYISTHLDGKELDNLIVDKEQLFGNLKIRPSNGLAKTTALAYWDIKQIAPSDSERHRLIIFSGAPRPAFVCLDARLPFTDGR